MGLAGPLWRVWPWSRHQYDFTVVCGDTFNENVTITGADDHTVTGIPADVDCTVTETDNGGADSTDSGTDNTNLTVNSAVIQSVGEGDTAYFVNTYDAPETWALTIDKRVSDPDELTDGAEEYTFTVACGDTFTKNVTITGADTETVSGIPDGVDCTVTETGTGGANSTSSGTDDTNLTTGTVIQNVEEGDTAYFLNTYTPPTTTTVRGSGTVEKLWTGDEFDDSDVEVVFTTNRGDMEPGDSVTLSMGQTLTVTGETVTGLPANCTYVSDLSEDGESFTARSGDRHGTIDITNDVTCEDGSATVQKAWTGDDPGDDVTVTFTTENHGTLVDGETVDLEVGETITITGETVEGLTDGCSYTSDLPAGGWEFTPTEDDLNETLVVTNDVDCEDEGDVGGDVTVLVGVEKVWDLSGPPGLVDLINTDQIDLTFTLDGHDDPVAPGDSVVAEPGDELTVTGEQMDEDQLPDACELTEVQLPDALTVEDATGQVLTVTNVVECAEVQGVVVEKPAPAPASLPATGNDTARGALLATLLAAIGGVMLYATRERQPTNA